MSAGSFIKASNSAGENSTNSSRGNKGKAKASLIAFIFLSLAKTLMSGVGTDLILSENHISETFAAQLIAKQQANDEDKQLSAAKPLKAVRSKQKSKNTSIKKMLHCGT